MYRRSLATWSSQITFENVAGRQRFGFNAEVPKPEGASRSHYVYITAVACILEEYAAKPVALNYNFKLLNGGSHLPADEDGMIFMHAFGTSTHPQINIRTNVYKSNITYISIKPPMPTT